MVYGHNIQRELYPLISLTVKRHRQKVGLKILEHVRHKAMNWLKDPFYEETLGELVDEFKNGS